MKNNDFNIRKSINDILANLDLPSAVSLDNAKVLNLKKQKNHYSLIFVDKLLFRVIEGKTEYALEVQHEYEKFFSESKGPVGKWLKIPLNGLDDIKNHENSIGEIFKLELRKIHGDAFGCCSTYLQCSDSKECVQEDFLLSLGCQYRINLLEGRIFYGKNRNC